MRTRLAGSFVVVLGTACRRDPGPLPGNPPAKEIRVRDQRCELVEKGSPRDVKGQVIDCPADGTTLEPDGSCSFPTTVDCSNAGENTCNPPAPVVVLCPPALKKPAPSASQQVFYPNPPPLELRAFDGECHLVPPGSPWTTPGKIVDCPVTSTTKDGSGKCFYEPGGDCPEGAKCNPPAPVPVRCPKGL